MDPKFIVALAFIAFLGLLVYLKVPQALARSLDSRADRIRAELEEARKLREEAQALLAEYQRKQHAAEEEAEAIVKQAKEEAQRMTREAREAMANMVARRAKEAEQKIAQAEAQAVADVRNSAAEAAATAAATVIAAKATGDTSDKLIAAGIKDVAAKLQ